MHNPTDTVPLPPVGPVRRPIRQLIGTICGLTALAGVGALAGAFAVGATLRNDARAVVVAVVALLTFVAVSEWLIRPIQIENAALHRRMAHLEAAVEVAPARFRGVVETMIAAEIQKLERRLGEQVATRGHPPSDRKLPAQVSGGADDVGEELSERFLGYIAGIYDQEKGNGGQLGT
ncbi:hypothetical protein [Polymorphospora lycopeni]|uniref:Uncharacterized protein n=1 Tax=Polymorphospora lycopeni TaxID=3140240 RepID=A0ABV5D4V6_9ACTN